MRKPEVQDALKDPRVQTLLDQLRKNPRVGDILMQQARRERDLMEKVMVLVNNGLLGMQTDQPKRAGR
jgi:hypothetical protein